MSELQTTQKGFSVQQAATFLAVMAFSGIASANEAGVTVETFKPIITMIMGLAAIVSAIGMAVLTVYATGKVFTWVKSAF